MGGRCSYPLRTTEPTGVIEQQSGHRLLLADLFAIWGQPLSPRRIGEFRTGGGKQVRAFVDGHPWRSDVRRIPLSRHAQIVLEIGARVPPHREYRFPPGV
jgi:hypothetical protein